MSKTVRINKNIHASKIYIYIFMYIASLIWSMVKHPYFESSVTDTFQAVREFQQFLSIFHVYIHENVMPQ